MIEFNVTSGAIALTDPCYERSTNPAYAKFEVLAANGRWLARQEEGGRFLIAHHENFAMDWRHVDTDLFDAAVDSGQFGIFDASVYPLGEVGKCGDESTFYGRCCAVADYFGAVDGAGVVSRTLYGDGSYPVHIHTNDKNEIVAVVVDFCPQEEDGWFGEDELCIDDFDLEDERPWAEELEDVDIILD